MWTTAHPATIPSQFPPGRRVNRFNLGLNVPQFSLRPHYFGNIHTQTHTHTAQKCPPHQFVPATTRKCHGLCFCVKVTHCRWGCGFKWVVRLISCEWMRPKVQQLTHLKQSHQELILVPSLFSTSASNPSNGFILIWGIRFSPRLCFVQKLH